MELHRQLVNIKPSNRNAGRGFSYHGTAKERDQIEAYLRAYGLTRKPFNHRVDVVLVRIIGPGKRRWDADSVLRGNAKELMDSLVACGWFHDDGPAWIRHVDGRQDDKRRAEGPAWEIIVNEVTE